MDEREKRLLEIKMSEEISSEGDWVRLILMKLIEDYGNLAKIGSYGNYAHLLGFYLSSPYEECGGELYRGVNQAMEAISKMIESYIDVLLITYPIKEPGKSTTDADGK